jgi:uncharacterized repeat protein (TIGR01451 family)
MNILNWVKRAGSLLAHHIWFVLFGLAVGLTPTIALAQANLQISSFTYTTPVLNGSTQTFTVIAKNNDSVAATNARLRVFLPSNFTFSSAPAGCFFENSPHTFNGTNNPDPALVYNTPAFVYSSLRMLYCDYASVPQGVGGDKTVVFTGVASASSVPNVAQMSADFYSDTTESPTTIGDDNYLEKQITVNSGADLALQTTPITVVRGVMTLIPPTSGASTWAGSALSATFKTQNNGPDPASTAQVQITLPSTANFTSNPVPTGSPWACTNASNTITCIYSGAAVAAGVNFADIVITGTVASNITGAVAFGVSIPPAAPQNATDPITTNNGTASATLNILAVAELAATKTLLAYGLATTPVAVGKPAIYRLGITNNGPTGVAANLATLTDTIGAGWVIGSMPTGCSLSSRTVTCKNASTLGSGAMVSFDIPVTAPASGTCPDNTATVSLDATMVDTNASNDTSPVVSCSWVPAAADIAATKRLLIGGSDVTQVAYGQAAVFRIGISNGVGQPVVPVGGAQVVDTFDAAWTVDTVLPAGCGKSGQTVTCTSQVALAAGQSTSFDISVKAPANGTGATNQATVALKVIAGLTDGNAANNTASITYTFIAALVDIRATKLFRFSGANVSSVGFSQPAIFRIGITNDASSPFAVPIGGASVVDFIPNNWLIGTPLPTGCSQSGQQVTCVNQTAINVNANVFFDIPVTAPAGADSCTGGLKLNYARVTLSAANMTDPTTAGDDTTVVAGGNTTSSACEAVPPNADIYVASKGKVKAGTGLLASGDNITNTIVVKNRSTSNAFATGIITVTDTLGPNEIFVSGGGVGGVNVWSACTTSAPGAVNGVVTCTIQAPAAGYAPNASLPTLTITTKTDLTAGTANGTTGLFTLTNSACAGRAADALYTLDQTSEACFSASITSSRTNATVALSKVAGTVGGVSTTLESAENTLTYTVTATASGFTGGAFIPTLVISDPIPTSLYGTFASLSPAATTTGVSAAVVSPVAGESCTVTANAVSCTLKNLVDSAPRAITVTVSRPVYSGGGIVNTATASSADSFIGTPTATATVTVEPRTEIWVTKSANPTTVRTGSPVLFTATINIDGPDGAANLKLLDVFDTSRFSYVAGSASITPNPNTGSCAVQVMNESTGDGVYDGVEGLQCNLGTINPDTIGTRKTIIVSYSATPKFPYPDAFNAIYTNRVRVKTDTVETNTGNNTASVNVTIQAPSLDLSVTKTDVTDPVEWDDSALPNGQISYLIKAISAAGSASTAHNVKVIDVPAPPVGFTMTYASSSVNGGGSYTPAGGVTCTPDNGGVAPTSYVTCTFADLPADKQVWLNMTFNLAGGSPPRALSFNNVAKICADEGGPTAASQSPDPAGSLCGFATVTNYDPTPSDNRISERTTILPLTDLHAFYKKPVIAATTTEITTVQLNEEFDYLVKVRNKGPVDSFLATVTDALPAGFRRTATVITVTPGSAVGTTNGNTCSSAVVANVETMTCSIGPLPADLNADGAEDTTKSWLIRIPVKADPTLFVTANQPYNTNIPNTVSIAPAQDPLDLTRPLSKDKVSTNNTATGNIMVPVKAKISGRVYEGVSLTVAPTGSESGIGSVVMTLTGLSDAGAACTTPGVSADLACGITRTVNTTAGTGVYLFDNLPPGRYTVEETQPASHFDGRIYVGTRSIGTGPAGTASVGFVVAGVKNSIVNIGLANNEIGINYNFEEYLPIAISGLVFEDRIRSTGNGGVPDASNTVESRIAGVKVRISGTDYAGNVLGGVATYLEQTTAGTGTSNYAFTSLPPPNASGYTLTEIQPTAYINGPIDPPITGVAAPTIANISGGTNVIGAIGTYSRPDLTGNTTYSGIKIDLKQAGTNYNFPEVRRPTLSGRVYIDVNANNSYTSGTDTNIQGATVVLRNVADLANSVATTTTAANGTYSFANLDPLITYVLEEPLPTTPTGLSNQALGVNVGTVNAVVTGTAAANTPIANTDRITGIDLSSGVDGINYNFGEGGTLATTKVLSSVNGAAPGASVKAGDVLIYTVTTTTANASASTSLCESTPANTSYTGSAEGWSAAQGTCAVGTTHNQVITVNVGTPVSKTYTVTVANPVPDSVTTIDNTVAVTNGTCTTCTVSKPTGAKLAILKTVAAATVNAGQTGSYTLTVSNLGGSATSGLVTLTDTLPTGLSYASTGAGTLTGMTCSAAGQVVTCSGTPNLAAGASATVLYTVNVAVSATGTLTNDVKFTTGSIGGDPRTPSCNAATPIAGANSQSTDKLCAKASVNVTTSISGVVFNDRNRGGTKDGTEPGIAGVSLKLVVGTDCSATAFSFSALTNPATSVATTGAYSFSPVPYGAQYTICETQPGGYADGPVGARTSINIGTLTTTGSIGNNFPEVLGSLSGTVFADYGSTTVGNNNNGTQETDETGIGSDTPNMGIPITLSGTPTAGPSLAAVSLTTYTDALGNYSFADLFPGTYLLTEGAIPVALGTFNDGINTAGLVSGGTAGTAGAVGINTISTIILAAGSQGTANNFAELPVTSISGTVYLDLNENTTMEVLPTDSRLGGVTLTLYPGSACTGTPTGIATTSDTGVYSFLNLSSGVTYTVCETQPPGYEEGAVNPGTNGVLTAATINAITVTNLPVAGSVGNNFGERGGTLSGFVYVDTNNNGIKDTATDPRELGIANVHVTLSGTTSSGLNVCSLSISCVATTIASGAFSFVGVPPGSYQLVETQTDIDGSLYGDGKETAGVAGGVVDNTTQGSQVNQNTIKTIAITPAVLASSAGNVSDYLFGEVPRTTAGLKPPIVSGYIYMDRKHLRIRPVDGTLEGQASWTVVLSQNGSFVCSVTSDANGFYQFDNLRCPTYVETGLPTGTGFSIRFSNSGNNLPNVTTSGGSAGATSAGTISGITLKPNDEITEQNLPLDPAGVVYNVLTRQPVAGATVVIAGPPGFNPVDHLVGGAAAQTQTTGLDGRYSFWLQNAFPDGTYSLVVTAPAGYHPGASLILPACAGGALTVGLNPNPGLVQQSNDAPALTVAQHAPAATTACVGMVAGGAATTQYYFSFGITNGGSAAILNNHIPLDPVTPTKLVLTKSGDKKLAEVGDTVLYTIAVRNGSGAALPQVTVKDRLPAGFTFIRGTAAVTLGSARTVLADPLGGFGPMLGFNIGNLPTGQTSTLTYRVRIGVGSLQGTGINTARAYGCGYASGCLDPVSLQALPHGVESNEGEHRVEVTGGVFTDDACLLGKVFVDCNNNHIQDAEELGVPGVRLYLENGQFIVTDSEGKYSRCGITPRSHVLTPDPSTLPRGSVLTTTSNRNLGDANSLFIDLKNGELHRGDFAEGSCTNNVLEQVKARRSQGEVRSVETEKSQAPALRFLSKPLSTPQQGTDSANQPLVQPRQGASDAR